MSSSVCAALLKWWLKLRYTQRRASSGVRVRFAEVAADRKPVVNAKTPRTPRMAPRGVWKEFNVGQCLRPCRGTGEREASTETVSGLAEGGTASAEDCSLAEARRGRRHRP